MSTPNLGITYIQAAQNQKEVTANNGFLALDEALCQPTTIAMSDADFYAAGSSSPAVTNLAFFFTGTLSDNRSVFLPINPKMYLVNNNTTGGKTLTFKIPDGSPATFGRTVTIKSGSGYHLIYCDGANVDEMQVSQENANLAIALSDANYILSSAFALNYWAFTFTGSLSDNRAIMLPAIAKSYVVKNSTTGGKNIVFEVPSSGSPATFGRTATIAADGNFHLIYSDGVNVDNVFDVTFGASGPNHSAGAVPDPGSVAGTGRFLREDGTWTNQLTLGLQLISGTDGTTGLIIQNHSATSTGDLVQFQDFNTVVFGRVKHNGTLDFFSGGGANGAFSSLGAGVDPSGTPTTLQVVMNADSWNGCTLKWHSATQSGDFIEFLDNNGVVLAKVTKAGQIQAPTLVATAATPVVAAGQVGIGTTTGFGTGAAGTAVTTTLKGAGSGPATPQTVVNYIKINIAGTDYWVPLVQ